MKRFFIVTLLLGFINSIDAQANYYFPDKNEQWKQKPATDFKIDQTKIDEAVAYATSNEYSGARDLRIAILKGFEREPYHEILGPTKKRGGPAGLILKNGYVIAKCH